MTLQLKALSFLWYFHHYKEENAINLEPTAYVQSGFTDPGKTMNWIFYYFLNLTSQMNVFFSLLVKSLPT